MNARHSCSAWQRPLGADARLIGLLLAATFATAAFGGVLPWVWVGLLTVLLVLWAHSVGPGSAAEEPRPARAPLVPAAGAVLVLVLVQLAPLPQGLLERLAPASAAVLAEVLPDGRWRSASLDLGATAQALWMGLLYLAAFVIATRALHRPDRLAWALSAFVIVAVLQALYGIYELSTGEARVFGWTKPAPPDRASGTFVNPNHFAAMLAMALPAALGLALAVPWRTRALPRAGRARWITLASDPSTPKRLLLLCGALVLVFGLAASQSRGGLVAALLGLVALGALVNRARPGRLRALLLGASLAATALLMAVLGFEQVAARFGTDSGAALLSEPSAAARLGYARDTLRMAYDHPLWGIGAGAFMARYPAYQTESSDGLLVNHAHCDYVELLAELGGPGALGLAVGFVATAYIAWRRLAGGATERTLPAAVVLACLVPLAAQSAVDFAARVPAIGLWGALLLGLSWAALDPDEAAPRPAPADAGSEADAPAAVGKRWARAVGPWLATVTVLAPALLFGWADWKAAPFVERAMGDPRSLSLQLVSLERATRRWPLRADHCARLGAVRWAAALERGWTEAEDAARAITDPGLLPSDQHELLVRHLFAARAVDDARLTDAAAAALADIDQALALAPADPRWRTLRREVARQVTELLGQRP